MKKKITNKEITDDISEQIWKYVWNNANNEDTDEDLCKRYENGEYLKFIN